MKTWPDYRAVWRWHFYAGLLCIPLVIVLSISGGIYLFKPQVEAWDERKMDDLRFTGPAAPVAEQVRGRRLIESPRLCGRCSWTRPL